jgi:hypothetical protein
VTETAYSAPTNSDKRFLGASNSLAVFRESIQLTEHCLPEKLKIKLGQGGRGRALVVE